MFYAGDPLSSAVDFESADLSLGTDLEALHDSSCFILLYPQEIATSALVEVGVAIGLRKPVVIHVPEDVKLPFLLRHEQGRSDTHGPIHIYRYQDFGDVLQLYRANPELLERLED